MLLLVRRIGAIVLIGAALYVWYGRAPDTPARLDHAGAVAAIELQDNANNNLSEGAPQQAVVNGWTTNSYLRLISKQLDANESRQPVRDIRPTELLALGVFGIALLAFTTPGPLLPTRSASRQNRSADRSATPTPPTTQPSIQPQVQPASATRVSASAPPLAAPPTAPADTTAGPGSHNGVIDH